MNPELTEYILKHGLYLMTEAERSAYYYSMYKDDMGYRFYLVRGKTRKMYNLKNREVKQLVKLGRVELERQICARLLKHHKDELINECPECHKLARTPGARQCRYCGHQWHNKKILVILDLDETLVHATSSPKDNNWDHMIGQYKVYKRPGLDQFLQGLKPHFDVAVWSSASDDYVHEIVKIFFPSNYALKFVWGRSKCTRHIDYGAIENLGYFDEFNHLNYTKRIKRLKNVVQQTKERILIVDDTPSKARHNYGNVIYPSEFHGDQNDNELKLLLSYLLTLKDVKNVRGIEKRGWQERNNTIKED